MAIIDQQLTTVDTFFVFTLGHTCLNKEHKKKQQKNASLNRFLLVVKSNCKEKGAKFSKRFAVLENI